MGNLLFFLLVLAGVWLAVRGLSALWSFRAFWSRSLTGSIELTGPPVHSPFNGSPAAYVRWSIQRRQLTRGRDDVISGEEVADFALQRGGERHPVNLAGCVLHLSDGRADAWTSQWNGLPALARETVEELLEGPFDDSLFHLTQVILQAGDEATSYASPALLSDLHAQEARHMATRVCALQLGPALVALAVGILGMLG